MSDVQPVVAILDGKLQGSVKFDWLGGKYYSFQGIPYAKSPLGNLRFKAPVPVEPWSGIKDATKEGSDCYNRHLITKELVGSEDCLFLNVYTPKIRNDNQPLKPVMFWIHGGAFVSGSGSTEFYGPDYLVSEDIVLVTINYRIGILGFARFGDPSLNVPGNAGFKDQICAMKWVQKNISHFGGDCNNVTIFGESAGGASVHLLTMSPLAKGLFHKAIAQSGVGIGCWVQSASTPILIAQVLGLENKTEKEIFEILNELPVEKVLELQEKFPQSLAVTQKRPCGLSIESPNDKGAFLTKDPLEILKSGNYIMVPFMIGYTSREGILMEFYQRANTGAFNWIAKYEDLVPLEPQSTKDQALVKMAAEKIKQFYYGNEEPSMENIDSYTRIFTDAYFFIDINEVVRQLAKSSSAPVYYYRMSLETSLNVFKRFNAHTATRQGASHADDIGYLFKIQGTPNIRKGTPEEMGLRRFLKLWSTFAKRGQPNPASKEKFINVTWLPSEPDKLHFLDIGENLTVGADPEIERAEFWDELYGLISRQS